MNNYTKCPCCKKSINIDRLIIGAKVDVYFNFKFNDFSSVCREFKNHYNSASSFIRCGECSFDLDYLFRNIYNNLDNIINNLDNQNDISHINNLYILYSHLIKETSKLNKGENHGISVSQKDKVR